MKARHSLSRPGAIAILAVCNQGDRSMDAVLHRSQENWDRLREFYSTDKRHAIKLALAELGIGEPFSATVRPKPPQNAFLDRLPLFTYRNKSRQRWPISTKLQGFLASCLTRLLACLGCDEQPSHDQLVQLRLDLATAGSFLDRKLAGIPELPIIRNVEYYAPPAGKRLYPIHELIAGAAWPNAAQPTDVGNQKMTI